MFSNGSRVILVRSRVAPEHSFFFRFPSDGGPGDVELDVARYLEVLSGHLVCTRISKEIGRPSKGGSRAPTSSVLVENGVFRSVLDVGTPRAK